MQYPSVVLALPSWMDACLAELAHCRRDRESRMRLVIELARRNVRHGTGGPFGAAVFERDTGRLVAPGVNLVVPGCCSIAHAEIVALGVAQRVCGTHDLGAAGLPAMELLTSTEPCAMCLGAIPWSGVRGVACGARDEDARAIGMDEGSKPPDWARALMSRGIEVHVDICRDEATSVLQDYAGRGGIIYNGRGGGTE